MAKKETRTVPLGLRVTPSLRKALDQAAADDGRTLASYVERVIAEHLRKEAYLR
jgi:hypothetical protein